MALCFIYTYYQKANFLMGRRGKPNDMNVLCERAHLECETVQSTKYVTVVVVCNIFRLLVHRLPASPIV